MKHGTARSSGFTLLEMLVVLCIVALASGLAAPSISRWMERGQERAWRVDLASYLQSLPMKARAQGVALNVTAEGIRQDLPDLPAGVKLKFEQPLEVAPNGATTEALLVLTNPNGVREMWRIQAVTGRLTRGS